MAVKFFYQESKPRLNLTIFPLSLWIIFHTMSTVFGPPARVPFCKLSWGVCPQKFFQPSLIFANLAFTKLLTNKNLHKIVVVSVTFKEMTEKNYDLFRDMTPRTVFSTLHFLYNLQTVLVS